ncbi:uncharacterized protein LOC108911659 [Anoplophora glabripennis]|uniref:uncharacterized protein LOC108911659 n=1 Tax=Anoplophora glabripennis TaxID=217634 RepID=UPI000874555E|nr:uncharacterized protein LOC108911659 [Anoplophora glabripennis]
MIEIDDELACYIHGIVSSDSDSDCDVSKELDEVYNLLKPPPYDYESIKNKIVTISSQNTTACQNELMNLQNDDEIERIEFVNDVTSKTKKDKNAVQKLNGAQNIEIKFRNKKTNVGKRIVDLYAQVACSKSEADSSLLSKSKAKSKTSKRSQKKEKSKYSTARTYKQRNIVLHEEKHIGLNIRTREEFVKEFPSVDEVYKDRCRSKRKIFKTQPNTLSVKQRKKRDSVPWKRTKLGSMLGENNTITNLMMYLKLLRKEKLGES